MRTAKDVLVTSEGSGRQQDWTPTIELATVEVFDMMMGSKLTVFDGAIETQLDTTAMVGLAGQLCGILSVRCNKHSAAMMASKMLGMDVDKVGPEMSDALGEVCNMVAGNFKNKIPGLSEGCMLSVPTVITGSDYCLHSLADSPAYEVKLMFESVPIMVTLQVER